jgi:hypothetical protein
MSIRLAGAATVMALVTFDPSSTPLFTITMNDSKPPEPLTRSGLAQKKIT